MDDISQLYPMPTQEVTARPQSALSDLIDRAFHAGCDLERAASSEDMRALSDRLGAIKAEAEAVDARLARVVRWAKARLSLDGFEPQDTPFHMGIAHDVAWEALEPGDLDEYRQLADKRHSAQAAGHIAPPLPFSPSPRPPARQPDRGHDRRQR